MVEIWKQIEGYPLYDVSNKGRVRSWNGPGSFYTGIRSSKPKILKKRIWTGRANVFLGKGNSFLISRLVCAAFHGPCPKGMECCHNNKLLSDDRASNLRWGTHRSNRRRSGTKLTEKNVEQIVLLSQGGMTQKDIAIKFSISQSRVCQLVNGKLSI